MRELLSQGLTLREAQKILKKEFGNGIGWKNVEKYKLLIYMDPRVPIMPPKGFMRDYSIVFGGIKCVEELALVLNEVAKYTAFKLLLKSLTRKRIRGDVVGKEWYSLCQDLLKNMDT